MSVNKTAIIFPSLLLAFYCFSVHAINITSQQLDNDINTHIENLRRQQEKTHNDILMNVERQQKRNAERMKIDLEIQRLRTNMTNNEREKQEQDLKIKKLLEQKKKI